MSTARPADQNSAAAAESWIGQRVGSHRIVRLLGAGGMGMVFEGTHEGVAGRAAVKVMRAEVASRPEVVARFFNGMRGSFFRRGRGPVERPGRARERAS